jgi:hypothetical protein
MKRTNKLLIVLALLTLLLIPASPALAKSPFDGGPVIFGGNYTLNSGDTLDSDLVVFGGNVVVKENATVKGSIVVFGGSVTLNGTMNGDLVIFGGSGTLQSKAVVKGDFVTVGGSFTRAEGARVEGEIRNQPTIEIPAPTVPDVPETPTPPQVNVNPFGSAIQTLVMAVVMGALAMLLTLFMQPQMDRVAQTAIQQTLVAGGVGLLAMFSIPVMTITLILIPVAILAAFVLLLAWVLGITSLGMEVGDRFTRAIDQNWTPVLSAGFGTFLLMLVVGGIGTVPCVGWIAPFLVGMLGIGAAVLTFLNSRAKPQATPAAPVAPSEPLPPAS